MEEEEDKTPFWLQTTDNRGRRRRRRRSSLFNNGVFVIIFLVLTAFAFIFFIIPSFLSFTAQVFSPHLVKKSWNSLNLVLVLFAVLCGFLSGNGSKENGGHNEGSYGEYKFSDTPRYDLGQRLDSLAPRQLYEYSDRNSLRRMRSSISYPDLRQDSPWTEDDDRWRFYDDTHVYDYRGSTSNQINHRRLRGERNEEGGFGSLKDIGVDSFVTQVQRRDSHSPPPQSPPLPPPPPHQASPLSPPWPVSPPPRPESPLSGPPSPSPPPPLCKGVRRRPKRTYQDIVATKTNSEIRDHQPLTPPPPPPPPPPPFFEKSCKSEKGRGGATKDFLNSLRRKKKKQRQRSVENIDSVIHPEPAYTLPPDSPPSPPPPPPPPPPPAFFHNIFSTKKNQEKKTHPPAPRPPPLAPLEARASRVVSQEAPVTTRKAPLAVKIRSNNDLVEENTDSGNESPLITIPPPPPLPPFKMPEWKFVVQGDFIRVKSIQSSRSGSPDSDGVEDPLSGESSPLAAKKGEPDVGDSSTAMFCPSPDVNTKADNFIARFRAGLQLEKMNSVKRGERSNLGSDPDPSPDVLRP